MRGQDLADDDLAHFVRVLFVADHVAHDRYIDRHAAALHHTGADIMRDDLGAAGQVDDLTAALVYAGQTTAPVVRAQRIAGELITNPADYAFAALVDVADDWDAADFVVQPREKSGYLFFGGVKCTNDAVLDTGKYFGCLGP